MFSQSALLQSRRRMSLMLRKRLSIGSSKTLIGQYKAIKNSHKEYIVLLQSGEFYEIFGDDAGTDISIQLDNFVMKFTRE